MTSVCLGIFALEIVLSCIAKPGYIFGYYFWLDTVSTVSLMFDIGWVNDAIFQTGAGTSSSSNSAALLSKASRTSQVGTRAARIVRIIRLIRLVRLVKIYKMKQDLEEIKVKDEDLRMDDDDVEGSGGDTGAAGATPQRDRGQSVANRDGNSRQRAESVQAKLAARSSLQGLQTLPLPVVQEAEVKQEHPHKPSFSGESDASASQGGSQPDLRRRRSAASGKRISMKIQAIKEEAEEEQIVETNVGRKLSDLTTRRVIALVLSVMISIPLFTTGTFKSDYTSYEYGLSTLYAAWDTTWTSPAQYSTRFNTTLNSYTTMGLAARLPLIKLDLDSTSLGQWADPNTIRNADQQYYVGGYDSAGNAHVFAIYDFTADNKLGAVLSIIRTIFVSVVLTGGALLFSKDAGDLIVQPIEKMLKRVQRIAKNPLKAVQIEEKEALLEEKLEKENEKKGKKKTEKSDGENYETAILERTIVKIGALLALGFGEAGSEIISQNMAKGGEVDPMIPGKKVMAIFGFCDIRNFTDATEILQQEVMVYVNEIAEIVHGTVDFFSGAANKNIGDAFLLVWKFPQEDCEYNDDGQMQLKDNEFVRGFADMALVSFLKIIAKINRSLKLDKYRKHAGLNQRMPNYSVKMGFGLHVGWAIEGAIGSEYKIDASYLSPNVNMAARLEAATKQFGVPLLLSGAMKDLLTDGTRKHVRVIDKVTVKGSIQPIEICTVDLDMSKLKVNKQEKDIGTLSRTEKKKMRLRNRSKRDKLKEKVALGEFDISKFFETEKDLKMMRETYTIDFEEKWREGFQHYLEGDWDKAKEYFEDTLAMIPGKSDGPSNTLLRVIQEHGGKAPIDWNGYRELTEK